MKPRQRRILTTVAVIGGLYLLTRWIAARTYDKIAYSAGGLRVHKLNANGLDLRMTLTVTNQSDIPAPVSAFIGNLYYTFPGSNVPTDLGKIQQVAPVQLPGFGSVDIEFKVQMPLLGSALNLLNLLTDGHPFDFSSADLSNVDPKRFYIKGTLKIGALPIDIQTTLV